MNWILIIPLIASLFSVILFLPTWIKKMKKIKFVGEDMNKVKRPKVAKSGGFIAIMGFLVGLFIYIAIQTFYSNSQLGVIEILALIAVVLTLTVVGLIDDLLGKKSGGLTRRVRILLLIFAAIPLIVINAGESTIQLPFLGLVNLGIIYPIFLIPLGIVGASATYNFLAGYNGLEAGQGIIILTSFSLISLFLKQPALSIICLCMVFALIGFFLFNRFPARTFPGNSLTLVIGALIAAISILGNFERIAVFIFIPYILETFLKLRGKLVIESFAKPTKNGLEMPKKKIYGLEHLAIKIIGKFKKVNEKDVVYAVFAFQIIIIILAFIIFRKFIFI